MTTIKSYTDIEQSRKLAEILPLESADMFWPNAPITVPCVKDGNPMGVNIPCWSLVALLGVLPNGILMNKDSQTGRYHFSSKYIETYVSADNPIDACYQMILMLHGLKML